MKKAEKTSCSLCGSKRIKTLFLTRDRMFELPGEFTLKKCTTCQLVFLDPQPTIDELKIHYPSQDYYAYIFDGGENIFDRLRRYLIAHYYKPNLLSRLFALVVKNVPAIPSWQKNGKVLDIGCGVGDTLVMLEKLGWDVYGLEIDKTAVKVAQRRGLNRVRLGTYGELKDYPDGFFDAIRLYHVVEHLDDPVYCLNLIKKKLKKNGELIIGTPNIDSFVSRLFGKFWYNLDTPRHLFLFSPKTLRRILEKEGFRVTQTEFCSAGGIVGSLGYCFSDLLQKKINLLEKQWLVVTVYPLEWLLDKVGVGDIFIIKASVV